MSANLLDTPSVLGTDNALETRVLLVDDNDTERLIISSYLKNQGYSVVQSQNGKEALEILSSDPIQLVISDWSMPELDGLDFCRAVRRNQRLNGTYFIILTGMTQRGDLIKAFEAGADDYIAKPVHKDVLRVRLGAGERICKLRDELAQQLASIQEDLKLASELQLQILPKNNQTFDGISVSSQCRQAIDLGGDMLNCFQIADDYLAFYILDVCGHGTAAAMMSFAVADNLNQLLKDLTKENFTLPHSLIGQLNERFLDRNNTGRYFTMVLGTIRLSTGEVYISHGGHPPSIVLRSTATCEEITNGGLPVGVFGEAQFETEYLKLSQGDSLILYSDGITEAENHDHIEYGIQRLKETATQKHDGTAAQILSSLEESCYGWSNADSLSDDLSIMVIQHGAET